MTAIWQATGLSGVVCLIAILAFGLCTGAPS